MKTVVSAHVFLDGISPLIWIMLQTATIIWPPESCTGAQTAVHGLQKINVATAHAVQKCCGLHLQGTLLVTNFLITWRSTITKLSALADTAP